MRITRLLGLIHPSKMFPKGASPRRRPGAFRPKETRGPLLNSSATILEIPPYRPAAKHTNTTTKPSHQTDTQPDTQTSGPGTTPRFSTKGPHIPLMRGLTEVIAIDRGTGGHAWDFDPEVFSVGIDEIPGDSVGNAYLSRGDAYLMVVVADGVQARSLTTTAAGVPPIITLGPLIAGPSTRFPVASTAWRSGLLSTSHPDPQSTTNWARADW